MLVVIMELSKYFYLKYKEEYDWDIKEKDFEQELKEDPVWKRYINCRQIGLDIISDIVTLFNITNDNYEIKRHSNNDGYCLKLTSINVELDIEVFPTLNLIEFKSSKILIEKLEMDILKYLNNEIKSVETIPLI